MTIQRHLASMTGVFWICQLTTSRDLNVMKESNWLIIAWKIQYLVKVWVLATVTRLSPNMNYVDMYYLEEVS